MVQFPLESPADPGAWGIPAALTRPRLQSAFYKELVSKLAWALGTTYDRPYSNTRTDIRVAAGRLAGALIREHGYGSNLKR